MSGPKFSSRLVLAEYVEHNKSKPGDWVVFEPLFYDSIRGRITVPRGFITDLASIPRLVRNLLDVNDSHRRAAVLHDYGYVMQMFTRKETDDLFYEAMVATGVPVWKRYLMYQAVRTGGWIYWNKRAEEVGKSGDFVGPDYFSAV